MSSDLVGTLSFLWLFENMSFNYVVCEDLVNRVIGSDFVQGVGFFMLITRLGKTDY